MMTQQQQAEATGGEAAAARLTRGGERTDAELDELAMQVCGWTKRVHGYTQLAGHSLPSVTWTREGEETPYLKRFSTDRNTLPELLTAVRHGTEKQQTMFRALLINRVLGVTGNVADGLTEILEAPPRLVVECGLRALGMIDE